MDTGSSEPFASESREGAVLFKVLSKKLSFGELDEFGSRLKEMTKACAGMKLILDFDNVQMVSSVVVGRIFQARKELESTGGRLIIVANTEAVLTTIKFCRLDVLVPVYSTADEAYAA